MLQLFFPVFIEACIANERRAINGSPAPRAFTSALPNIGCAGIHKLSQGFAMWQLVKSSHFLRSIISPNGALLYVDWRYFKDG
jgi:hypothetical protein